MSTCGHLLPAQAEGGPPEAVDPGPQQGLPCFPQCLNAQEDCCRHQERRRHDQVLDKAIVYVFFQKYIRFFKLARFLFPENKFFWNRKPVFSLTAFASTDLTI